MQTATGLTDACANQSCMHCFSVYAAHKTYLNVVTEGSLQQSRTTILS